MKGLQQLRAAATLPATVAEDAATELLFPMKPPRSVFQCAVLTLAILNGAWPAASLAAVQPKEKVLIDFTSVKRDPDGKVFRVYEYAFGDWDKHIVDLAGRGTLIKAPTGKGGLGENKTMVQFGKASVVDLQFVIGNANQTEALSFSLEDKDGSEWTWTIPLAGKPHGQLLGQRLDLGKSESEQKAGTTPGMNLKKIGTWQVRGNYSDAKVEVLLVKLTAEQ